MKYGADSFLVVEFWYFPASSFTVELKTPDMKGNKTVIFKSSTKRITNQVT